MHIETIIKEALRARAESFEASAKEARKGASAPNRASTSEQKQVDGSTVVDLTPTPEGFEQIAKTFDAEAKDARELLNRIEEKGLRTVVYQEAEGPDTDPPRARLVLRTY